MKFQIYGLLLHQRQVASPVSIVPFCIGRAPIFFSYVSSFPVIRNWFTVGYVARFWPMGQQGDMCDINRFYREELKRDLAKDITSDTSGDFRNALLSLAKGDRSEDFGVNEDLADSDARALYEAGERRKGTDVNVFNTILTTRSYPHLRRVFQKYTKYSKHDMNKVLDLELKGDIEKCLTAIVKCATSKPAFFAEKLHQAMKGAGTRHKALIRIMVSRSEIDMNDIKAFYQKMYGISLCQAILDETKGDYEKILVALCGGN